MGVLGEGEEEEEEEAEEVEAEEEATHSLRQEKDETAIIQSKLATRRMKPKGRRLGPGWVEEEEKRQR